METSNNTEQRLTDLEIKASFTEDLLDQLNQIIVRQQEEIAMLIREVGQLRQQMPDSASEGFSRASEELPPHY
jgi:SlyX protein